MRFSINLQKYKWFGLKIGIRIDKKELELELKNFIAKELELPIKEGELNCKKGKGLYCINTLYCQCTNFLWGLGKGLAWSQWCIEGAYTMICC